MIHSRLDGLEKDVDKWFDMLPSVLKKYDNTKHSTTGLAPNEAVKPSSHMDVWLSISSKATYNRNYPPLKIGSQVRTYVKPHNMKKGHGCSWSNQVYTIQLIKYGTYLLNGYQERRVYRRHELLRVDASEGKYG